MDEWVDCEFLLKRRRFASTKKASCLWHLSENPFSQARQERAGAMPFPFSVFLFFLPLISKEEKGPRKTTNQKGERGLRCGILWLYD
jgi:hypothetical protein